MGVKIVDTQLTWQSEYWRQWQESEEYRHSADQG